MYFRTETIKTGFPQGFLKRENWQGGLIKRCCCGDPALVAKKNKQDAGSGVNTGPQNDDFHVPEGNRVGNIGTRELVLQTAWFYARRYGRAFTSAPFTG